AHGHPGARPRLRLRSAPAGPGRRRCRRAAQPGPAGVACSPARPLARTRTAACGDHRDQSPPPLRRGLTSAWAEAAPHMRRTPTESVGVLHMCEAVSPRSQPLRRARMPSRMMRAAHTLAMSVVNRLRLRSATPDDPSEEDIPPPNMSDMPPPLPLCMRISRVRKMLVSTSRAMRMMLRISTSDSTYVSSSDSSVSLLRDRGLAQSGEVRSAEAGAADERAVDVCGGHDLGHIVGLDGSAVEDPSGFGQTGTELLTDPRPDGRGHLGGIRGGGGLAGADGPDRFVGDDEPVELIGGESGQRLVELTECEVDVRPVLALLQGLPHADDRGQLGLESGSQLRGHDGVRLMVVRSPLTVS